MDRTLDHAQVGSVDLHVVFAHVSVRCDKTSVWTGKAKLPDDPRSTYGTAQKMQAAISHKFGCDYGLGTQQWMEHPTIPGKFIGNPSLSVVVSQYMVSLHWHKVCLDSSFSEVSVTLNPLFQRFALVRLSPVLKPWTWQQ